MKTNNEDEERDWRDADPMEDPLSVVGDEAMGLNTAAGVGAMEVALTESVGDRPFIFITTQDAWASYDTFQSQVPDGMDIPILAGVLNSHAAIRNKIRERNQKRWRGIGPAIKAAIRWVWSGGL